ncbi:hypothetical protein BLJ79_16585 [Arthrobacter sp. UCD-GKA]|uniref:restriction endonuclease n=1 Tax=Arthrobacter sp. UCD-GKA TaxID=1913576 RepID=UPI0008DD9DEA|nr:restriction endonuclease [Arthrobacter sp. UCD-GKA]OIH83204.1 hypothetical protein BLJ79_16585 [Arthrobacter sp. UCD-GKA]
MSESEALEKVLEMLHARILLVQGQNAASLRSEEESARKRAAAALKNQEAEKAAVERRAEEGRWISDEVQAPRSDVILARRESALSAIVLRYPGLVDNPSVYGEFADRAWRATFQRNHALSESEALEKVLEMLHARILLVQGQNAASLRAEEESARKRAAAALEKVKSDRIAAKLRADEESQAITDEQRWLNLPLERLKAQKEDAEWRAGAAKRKVAAAKREAARKVKVEADQQAYAEWCRKNKPKQLHITDWDKAERNAEMWMRFMGFVDARQTGAGADGGIDVVATGAAAQVKREGYDIGRPALQGFKGAAWEYEVHLFFSSSGYTKQAVDFANSVKMELYVVGPYGEVTGGNQAALDRLERVTEPVWATP